MTVGLTACMYVTLKSPILPILGMAPLYPYTLPYTPIFIQ